MQTPTKLSRHWLATRHAISEFLDATSAGGPAPAWNVVNTWFNNIITPVGGNQYSAEDAYDIKLGALFTARNNATGSGSTRRSARLVKMIQGAIGARQNGPGYFSDVGEAYPAASGSVLDTYRDTIRATAEAAANFLDALKNGASTITPVANALNTLLQNNPGIDPELWETIGKLRKAMLASLAAQGGGGEGSANWPSVTISSSSGG